MGLIGSWVLSSALGRFLVSWPALKAEDGCPPNQSDSEAQPGPLPPRLVWWACLRLEQHVAGLP